MTKRCSRVNCYAHDGEACQLGALDLADCRHWSSGEALAEVVGEPCPVSARVPWSGCALGLSDLINLTPRGRTILIGVLGAHDAGKTTLLIGNYLDLLRGRTLAGARFAGSITLQAWESLAAWVRFDDAARQPSFPPHTPRGTSRVPGLLHLALRRANDEFRDIILTDAPGEWFTNWAVSEQAPEADGARWIAQRADAFLVLADCQRLGGTNRGRARNDIRLLLERLGNHVGTRPTTLVWSKADQSSDAAIREQICASLRDCIPHATEVDCTNIERASLVRALEATLHPAWTPPRARALVEPILHDEPFEAFRGSDART